MTDQNDNTGSGVIDQPQSWVRITLTVPAEMQAAIVLMASRLGTPEEPIRVDVQEGRGDGTRRRIAQPAPLAQAANAAQAHNGAAAPAAGNRVIYKILDSTVPLGGLNDVIRGYLLRHGPASAQTIETDLAIGRKNVESSLTQLRRKGAVVSEAAAPAAAARG